MKLGERIGGGNTANIYAWGSDQILKVFGTFYAGDITIRAMYW